MVKFNLRLFFLFAFVILSMGLAWPINKMGLLYMSPLWYTTTRLIIGTLSMGIIVLAIGKLSFPKRQELPLIAIVGLLQISIFMLLANLGLSYLPAGRSTLIAYTTPLWIMPITTFILKEKTGISRWIGFFVGIIGLIILLNPRELDWKNLNTLIGTSLLLLASLGWAISMICVRHMHWRRSPLELMPWQLLMGTLPILIITLFKEPFPIILWEWPLILSLVYTGLLVTGIAYWICLIVNRELPTLVVSFGFLLVPVLSLFTSAYYMNEVVNLTTLLAVGCVLMGLMLVTA